jgi:hypothetical protein
LGRNRAKYHEAGARILHSWLIWLKAVNLAILRWLHYLVMSRYYPESKLY